MRRAILATRIHTLAVYQCNIHSEDPDWQEFCLNREQMRYPSLSPFTCFICSFAVFSLRFCDDGYKFVAGTSDHRIYVYDRLRNVCLLSVSCPSRGRALRVDRGT